jgi:hypothetical protein
MTGHIVGMQTLLSQMILDTVPNRIEFDKYQEKRIASEMANAIQDKIKFTWSSDGLIEAKCLKGEVAVMHVDEYRELQRELKQLKEENLYLIRERYSYTMGGFQK